LGTTCVRLGITWAGVMSGLVTAKPATAIVTSAAAKIANAQIATPIVAETAKAKTVILVVGRIAKTIPMPLDMEPLS
jgi:hypothetical protein